jgi:hypothetical protein
MKSNHCLTDIGEWSPFAIYQQRCRSGNWIYRIQYTLPNNNIVSCVSCRDMPLPSPSVSGSDAPPSRSDTPTYASSSGGPAALCTPSSSVALGVPPSGGTSTSATFGSPPSSPSILTRCYVFLGC